jgi:putative ATP-binding cassette transporter
VKKLKQFYYLVNPFWRSSKSLGAWLLLVVVIGLSLGGIGINVLLNDWNGRFYNSLQSIDSAKIMALLGEFVVIIGALILLVVFADFLRKKLLIKWRTVMTLEITQKWLSANGQHYHLQNRKIEPDNPDQRIAEDVNLLISQTLSLLITFLTSLFSFISFSAILWRLSGDLTFTVAERQITVPGYMFFVCLLYVSLGMICTHFIGRRLHGINVEKQRNEANYRSALITCREHGDSIAGQHGEAYEQHRLRTIFASVIDNWTQLIGRERNLLFFVNGFSQVSSLAPIFFALPKYISGAIQLGGLMQIRMAFVQVNSALSWFIFCYKDIAVWQATVTRLYNFVVLLDQPIETNVKINEADVERRLAVDGLQVNVDGRQIPAAPLSFSLPAGGCLLLKGVSGIGKSTLLKTLAGFGTTFSGTIERSADFIWLPQKTFLGSGKLADMLAYPQSAAHFGDSKLISALEQAELSQFIPELENIDDWQKRLSGGEQQRLLFARLFLHRPALLLLDEITSGLDTDSAKRLIAKLRQQLPQSAIVLVTHQNELYPLTDRIIDLDGITP